MGISARFKWGRCNVTSAKLLCCVLEYTLTLIYLCFRKELETFKGKENQILFSFKKSIVAQHLPNKYTLWFLTFAQRAKKVNIVSIFFHCMFKMEMWPQLLGSLTEMVKSVSFYNPRLN